MEVLAFIGFLGMVLCIILLIVSLVKKNGKAKQWGIGILASFIILMVGAVNSSNSSDTSNKSTDKTVVSTAKSTDSPSSTSEPAKPETTQANQSKPSNNESTSKKTSQSSSATVTGKDKGSNNLLENAKDQLKNIADKDNKYVQGVKNARPEQYPDKNYGDAFAGFFGSPAWKYFDATTGEKVVEFTGFCTYQDVEVKARLQFIISEDGKTFEIGALSFNDVPQNQLIKTSLLEKAFSEK